MTEALQAIGEVHRDMRRLSDAIADFGQRLKLPVAQADIDLLGLILDYVERHIEQVHQPRGRAYLYRALRLRGLQAKELIEELEREEAAGPALLSDLRQRLDGLGRADAQELAAFCSVLDSYAKRMQQHITRKETLLFPIARDLLSDADWKEIAAAIVDNPGDAVGQAARAQFDGLMRRMVQIAPAATGLATGPAAGALAPADTPLLQIEQLVACYGRIAALRSASLSVPKGKLVALVGANGAGKTTLLRTISGVQRASAGSIRFDGRDITRMRADRRVRLGICQVPEGRQVFGPLSVADNLRLGAFIGGDEKCIAKDLQRMYEMFPILRQKANQPAGTLSGGQQQMLAIARALMGRPRLLLLDEPSMGLAPVLVEEIFRAIIELRQQSITILLVEQNAHSALAIADDAYVMETGRIVMAGSGRELLADERVREAYLGL